MKKSCDNCKALRLGTTDGDCSLGYKIQVRFQKIYGLTLPIEGKPLEDCPKPKSPKKFNELMCKREIDSNRCGDGHWPSLPFTI